MESTTQPHVAEETTSLQPVTPSDRTAFAETSAAANLRAEEVCQYLFPNGRRQGAASVVGSWGGEPGQSLKITVAGSTAGRWRNLQCGGESGENLIEAWSHAQGVSYEEAAVSLDAWLKGPELPTPVNVEQPNSRPAEVGEKRAPAAAENLATQALRNVARPPAVRPLDQGAKQIVPGAAPQSDDLTDQERADFARYRAQFNRIAKTWIEFGEALRDIRDRRLYRGQYATFADFCRAELEMGKSNAHRLLQCAEIATLMSTKVDIPLREAHVRPLLRLQEPEQQVQAFVRAVDQAREQKKSFTAAFVSRAVRETLDSEKQGNTGQRAPAENCKRKVIRELGNIFLDGLESEEATLLELLLRRLPELRAKWITEMRHELQAGHPDQAAPAAKR